MDVREKLVELLAKYFDIGDSYAYNLTRVKSAFAYGTMGFDDFEEFDEETVAAIADYLIRNGVTVQENVKMSDELLKQLKNAPITIYKSEPSIVTVQEWISVDDRLPEVGGYVVCIAKRNPFSRFMPMVARIEKNGWVNPITEQYISEVTHWMPLPVKQKGE